MQSEVGAVERRMVRAITMNARTEIFYIARGVGDATPNIAVPTDKDLYGAQIHLLLAKKDSDTINNVNTT